MKKKQFPRKLTSALALVLTLSIAIAALAEGTITQIYHAGTQLLFDTSNATIKAHADFAYNGVKFKIFDGEYRQAGLDSYMDVSLTTPKVDGGVYEGGYTVYGEGSTAYAFEHTGSQSAYYQTQNCARSESILSSTVMRQTLLNFGSALISATEGAFQQGITTENLDNGGAVHKIVIDKGDTPELLNAAGTLLAQLAAKIYYNVNYDWAPNEQSLWSSADNGGNEVYIHYEDYEMLEKNIYLKLFNEEMPADFYAKLWGDDEKARAELYERYSVLSKYISDIVDGIHVDHTTGSAIIRTDGSVDYFSDIDEFQMATGSVNVHYISFDGALRAYYESQTGNTLTEKELNAIRVSNNAELLEAVGEMETEMDNMYREQLKANGTLPVLLVHADGSSEAISYSTYREIIRSDNKTLTSRILGSMHALELDTANVTVHMDALGRITAMAGDVCVQVIDSSGMRNPLEVTFDITCTDYGTTEVESFDPEKLGLMSMADYHAYLANGGKTADLVSVNDLDDAVLETVVFNGVKYQVTVENGLW